MVRFAWRNAAQPFVKAYVDRGIGVEQAMRELRTSGYKFGTEDFRKVYREAQGDFGRWSNIKFANRGAKPASDLFKGIKPTWDEAYEYTLRVNGRSTFTGETITRNLAYRTNQILSREELVEEVRSWFREGVTDTTEPLELEDVLPVEAYKNLRVVQE